jgi:LPPG:FO 2-phospho-L-lactate transferase
MKVTLLAGGTGGTKLAHGFALLGDEVDLTVIANVGDDTDLHGLRVCPDIDALLYTLSGLIDGERGWGVRGDTFTAHLMLARYGEPSWFSIGDADLATHVERSRLLREERLSLTDATAAMAGALGISTRILPATDDDHRTIVETDEGPMDFQDYFVRRRQEPAVRGIHFAGDARPTSAVLEAIAGTELLVIGPSNPIVSIGPILALEGVRAAVAGAAAPRLAISPIIGGRALKGPADRMLSSLGHEVSAVGVARLYTGLVQRFVLDEADAGLAPEIASVGLEPMVLQTIMRADEDRRALARALVDGAAEPASS